VLKELYTSYSERADVVTTPRPHKACLSECDVANQPSREALKVANHLLAAEVHVSDNILIDAVTKCDALPWCRMVSCVTLNAYASHLAHLG
jgi:hypothetical protein